MLLTIQYSLSYSLNFYAILIAWIPACLIELFSIHFLLLVTTLPSAILSPNLTVMISSPLFVRPILESHLILGLSPPILLLLLHQQLTSLFLLLFAPFQVFIALILLLLDQLVEVFRCHFYLNLISRTLPSNHYHLLQRNLHELKSNQHLCFRYGHIEYIIGMLS